jgi:hypothetical protein
LCGADPIHQRHTHGTVEIERARNAVRAEIAKIRAERLDLAKATNSLRAEHEGLVRRGEQLAEEIKAIDAEIETKRPEEASYRQRYDAFAVTRDNVRKGLALRQRLDDLNRRKTALNKFRAAKPQGTVSIGVDGITGHSLAATIQSVLHAWRFPGLPTVAFESSTHDITINGKDRRSNGKGVRALMSAAFKIGVLLYCHERKLPHPGIVVLDSPLLSYREPLHSKYGALSPDEEMIVKSGLAEQFYKFLIEKSSVAQFVILENKEPPIPLPPPSLVTVFAGGDRRPGVRQGFF